MSGHYCSEHKAVFFKKGKMRGYAHPIGDTGEWCNEPEDGGDPIPEEKKAELKAESDGQNRSFALSYAKDITCAKIQAGKPTSVYEVIDVAVVFETYLDTGAPITKKESKPE